MSSPTAFLSIEQYLHTAFEVEPDYVDGRLEQRNVRECAHARLKGLLAFALSEFEAACDAVGVLGISLLVAPNRIRVCDVALLRRGSPGHHPISTPPLLCAEVMASEDRLYQVERVLCDYVTMGVEHIWLLDPNSRRSYWFDRNGLHRSGPELSAPGTAIRIHTEALFNEIR